MQFTGEHLLPGQLGNACVLLAFVSALLSCIAYLVASKDEPELAESSLAWKKLARISFRIHSLSVIGIIGFLFYMLHSHMFEYEYVWHHSSKAMRMRYILSCFWEGQEGSFLLWIFWHMVIGNVLIKTARKWEAPVMTIVASVQVFLVSMIVGIYLFDYRLGSNPFTVLLRQSPDFSGIPMFQNPDYLARLDGRGLNPLLQNYWMTIHPPTLFLGFALTLVPFAYAIAGLWKKKPDEWQKPALPWAFTGVMVLGTGILMGGAWAYEALSFGGFWAWDPVENSSLVPWLTLVGAAHVMLIHKHRGQSLFTTFFLTFISFILVLYSTFLTRSGILGTTSVHAFTDLGMSGQLLIYLSFYIVLAIVLLVLNRKDLWKTNEEEALWSREFWIFLGSLVLLISSFHIMFNTSLPVWNKLFNLKMAPPANAIDFYDSWQVPFSIIITLLMSTGQFLKYRNTDIKQVGIKIIPSLVISVLVAAAIAFWMHLNQVFFVVLLGSSIFCMFANADYFLRTLGGKLKSAGASVAHIGFGMILLGVLLSTSKKEFISTNHSTANLEGLDKGLSNSRNILLQVGDTLQMGDYYVTYKGKQKAGINIFFEIEYYRKQTDGKLKYDFTLKPLVQTNAQMGNVAEPDTRHFFNKDIYTHVTYANLSIRDENRGPQEEYREPVNHTAAVGDTISASNCLLVLEGFDTKVDKKKYHLHDSDIAIGAIIKIYDIQKKVYVASPLYVISHNQVTPVEAVVPELGLKINFWKITPETGKVELSLTEKNTVKPDFIVMEAIVFPWINLLWTGCIIMVIGTALAIVQKLKRR